MAHSIYTEPKYTARLYIQPYWIRAKNNVCMLNGRMWCSWRIERRKREWEIWTLRWYAASTINAISNLYRVCSWLVRLHSWMAISTILVCCLLFARSPRHFEYVIFDSRNVRERRLSGYIRPCRFFVLHGGLGFCADLSCNVDAIAFRNG